MHRRLRAVPAILALTRTETREDVVLLHAPTPLRTVVASEDDLDFTAAEYRDLFARSEATLFQHPDWLHRLYTVLAPRVGAQPVVLTVRAAETGRLLAVLPLARRRWRGLRLVELADLGVSDHAAAVVDRTAAAALRADPALPRRLRHALGRHDLLRVERCVGEPGDLATLLGTRTHRRHAYATHAVALPGSVAAWPGTLDPSFVRHLERKRKRLRPKGGVTFRVAGDPAEADALLDALAGWRRDRFTERGGTDLMQDPDRYAFYRAVALDAAAGRGPGVLSVLDVGGRPAAASLDLADDDRHVYLVVGYDVAALRNYSLGLLIVDELARHTIARGARTLDLTVGDEGYKADFAAQATPLWSTRRARTLRGLLGGLLIDLEAYSRPRAKAARDRLRDLRARRNQTPA